MVFAMKSESDLMQTSWTLIGRLRNVQDEKVWAQFYDMYKGLILGVSMKAGLSKEEAEDVLQTTMSSISKNIGGFESNPQKGSFTAWLLKLSRWRSRDQLDKRLPPEAVISHEPTETSSTPLIERVADSKAVDLDSLCDAEWKER